MNKNVAGQKLTVYAFDSTTGLPKTGDAANLTAYVSEDDGTVTVLTDTSATEKDATNAKGYYDFDLAQGETDANKLAFSCKSSTSNIVVLAMPAVVYTRPPNFSALGIESDGMAHADLKEWLGVAPLALSSQRVQVLVGAISNGVIAAATFAANALDAVWSTTVRLLSAGTNIVLAKGTGITGFNDLSAAQVNAEADAALADYDAPTHAELTAELATSDDAVLTQVALVKAKTDNLPSDPADASVIAGRFDTLDTSVADLPTNAELATGLGTADDAVLAQVALVKAKTDNLPSDPADQSLIIAATDAIVTAVGTRASQTSVDDLPTNAELAAALSAAAMSLTSAERNAIADAMIARSLGVEAVSAEGAVPTFGQAMFEILSLLGEFQITGADPGPYTFTMYKRDGTTVLFTSTSTSLTSRTRAT